MSPTPRAYFSPNGGCTAALVEEIAKARRELFVQAYSFTSAPIAKAVIDAHRRGVAVKLIVDKGQPTAKGSVAGYVAAAGVPTWVDAKHAIAHNKLTMIDGLVVCTGSFNYTTAAERDNAENLLILSDRELVSRYRANFLLHLTHSTPLSPLPPEHK